MNFISEFLENEKQIFSIYELLAQSKFTQSDNEYNYLKEQLTNYITKEKNYLRNIDAVLPVVYQTISMIYEEKLISELNGNEQLTNLEEIYIAKERIANRILNLRTTKNNQKIEKAFKQDLRKQDLIIVKNMLRREKNSQKQLDLMILYYILIGSNLELEEQFLTEESLLDIPESKFLELKILYPIDYQKYNKSDYLNNDVWDCINAILNIDDCKKNYSEALQFYRNLMIIRTITDLSQLTNLEYLELKSSIFKALDNLNLENINEINKNFSYRNINKGKSKILGLHINEKI